MASPLDGLLRSIDQKPPRSFSLAALVQNFSALLGPYAPPHIHDTIDIWMVSMRRIGEAFFRNGIHAWDPSILCGHPLLTYGYNLFHPYVWLSPFLPLWLLCSGSILLLSFLSGWGAYLYLSRTCRLAL